MNAILKRWPTAAVALIVAATLGWWLVPTLAALLLVAIGTERVVAHFEQVELRATVDSLQARTGFGLPEPVQRRLATWGEFRQPETTPAPALRPDQHWEDRETGGIRNWVLVTDKPTLRARLAAWLKTTAPRYQAQRELVIGPVPLARAEAEGPGRHRPSRVGNAPAAAVPTETAPQIPAETVDWIERIAATKAALGMPSGEFEKAVRRLEAEVYAGVARGGGAR